jgi:ABC-type branched-subunit amino acid transport system substrate-binding protein
MPLKHFFSRFVFFSFLPLLAAPSASAESVPFKVGLSIPLSGAFADYGVAVKNGIQLAIKEKPELFENLQFIFEDDHYEPKMAVTALNKLRDVDHIDLFFVWGNESALGIAPIVEQRAIPTLVVSQHPKAGAGYRYVIRFINPAEDFSKTTLEYLRGQNYKKLAVVKSEISFFNILLDELRKNLASGEEMVVYDTFLPTDFDFRSSIAKLKTKQLDALGVYLTPPQLIEFYRQASEQGFAPPTFGTTPFENKTVLGTALKYMNGAVYSQVYVSEEFKNRYLREFGNDVQISYAANAYDFASITAKLFGTQNKRLSANEIISSYTGVAEGEGASGHYRFKNSEASGNYFEFPVVIRKIEGDKVVVVPQASEKTASITIGLMTELSGQSAATGEDCRRGFEVARKEFAPGDQAGSYQIGFSYADTQGSPRVGVTEFMNLLDVRKALAVLVKRSAIGMAINPVAAQARIPLLGLVGPKGFTNANPYAFRFFPTSEAFGESLAQLALARGKKRIAIVSTEDDWQLSIRDEFMKSFAKSGGQLAYGETVVSTETDFSSVVSRIKQSSADSVLVNLGPGQTGIFIKKLREQGVKQQIFGNYYTREQGEIEKAGKEAVEGLLLVELGLNSKRIFLSDFQQMFPAGEATGTAYTCYTGLALVLDTLVNNRGVKDRQHMYQALLKTKQINLPDGLMEVKDRELQYKLESFVIRNGTVTQLEE